MAKVSDLKNSKFLTKEDVDPPVRVTIAGWDQVDVSLEAEPEKMRYTLSFKELEKSMVLNNTNGLRIQKITGTDNFDNWVGKEIILFNDETVMFGKDMVGGLRVQIPQQQVPEAVRPATTHVGDEPPPATDEEAAKNETDQIPF